MIPRTSSLPEMQCRGYSSFFQKKILTGMLFLREEESVNERSLVTIQLKKTLFMANVH